MDAGVLLFLPYFLPVVIVGAVGNCWVIIAVLRILPQKWHQSSSAFAHMSLYILFLCGADLMVLSMVPVLTSYFVSGSWFFGLIGCKIFFAVESVNKLLSIAILTLMSIERFLAVSRPLQWRPFSCCLRENGVSNALIVVVVLLIAIVTLCTPVIYYAETEANSPGSATTCGSNLPDGWMTVFIGYMFALGFLVPMVLITSCYYGLVKHLRKNFERNALGTHCHTRRVVRSLVRVAFFHFICWAPFWTFVLLPLVAHNGLLLNEEFLETPLAQNGRMISSFLPYVNASGNWIFYAVMNNMLRSASSKRRKQPQLPSSLPVRHIRSHSEARLYQRNDEMVRPSRYHKLSVW